MGDLTKFCEIFFNITLELPQYTLKSFFSCIQKLVKARTVLIYGYFFKKYFVNWSENSVRFELFYRNCLPDVPNSVRFYLTVLDMACMSFLN